jgi:hypothetical protein
VITVSSAASTVLTRRTFRYTCRAAVTLGGQVLAEDVPIAAGREESDDSLRVPTRVTLTVPRVVAGVDWTPDGPEHPLAPYGQHIHVKLGIDLGSGLTEWIDRGEFLIHSNRITPEGDAVEVTAVDLLWRVDEAGLIAPYRPTGTYAQALRNLVEPALTVVWHADLADDSARTVPSGLNYDEDRMEALLGLLTALDARAQTSPEGYLYVTPADYYPDGAWVQRYNFTSTSGVNQDLANVVQVAGAMTREDVYNAVVVTGQAADGGTVRGVSLDASGGPTSTSSEFNRLLVPFRYFSPLITTTEQAKKAAASVLRKRAGLEARRFEMTCVPDPRVLLNDQLDYRHLRSTYDEDEIRTVVERLTMPYTADSGPMQLTLRELES